MDGSTPGFPDLHHLPELAQTHVHWVGDAIQQSHILLSPSPPASISTSIRVFANESALCISWSKNWSFSFIISPSNEYSGLISFRIDWFDLLAVQKALKGLLQHHSSKASVLWHSAFFMVQLSHPYMTTGKTISGTIWIFVGKVMLFFNTLSRFVIAFLLRSKWLNFNAAVAICSDFGAQENKICHCFHFFLSYLSWNDGTWCHDPDFLNVEVLIKLFTVFFHLHQETLQFPFTFCL